MTMNNISIDLDKTCSGCGLCESICPVKAISVEENRGFFRPEVRNSCIGCGKCISACPGRIESKLISYQMFKYIQYGHSNNMKLRKEAASGALTTEILKYLLREGIVDYVVTAGVYQNDKNAGFVVVDKHCVDNLDKYSGSNYCPTNIGRAIRRIKEIDGKYAVVCLPCLARGLDSVRKTDNQLGLRIKFVITLLCNHIPSYEATEYLIRKYKICHPRMIKYRGNGWFGSFRAYNTSEKETEFFSVPFSEYFGTKYSEYFWQQACINCKDHFGIFSDVCMGDADFVKYREDKENDGETILFSNNHEMVDIICRMDELGIISVFSNISKEELEEIYGPLCDENRASDRNLRSGVSPILREEQICFMLSNTRRLISEIKRRLLRSC